MLVEPGNKKINYEIAKIILKEKKNPLWHQAVCVCVCVCVRACVCGCGWVGVGV